MGKSTIHKRIECVKKTIGVAIVLLCGVMVLTVPAVQADTIVQNATWSYANVSDDPFIWSASNSINKFDSSLGTLNSVTLSFTSSVYGTIQVENRTGAKQVTSYLSATTTLTDGGSTTYFTLNPTSTYVDNLTAHATYDWAGTDAATHIVDQLNAISAISSNIVYTTSLESWTGSGTLSFTATSTDASGTSTSNVNFQDSGVMSNGGLTVTYNYTTGLSVPEPSSSLIFLLGLVGIAGLNRRFRSQPEDPVASIHWSDWGFRNQDEI